MSWKSTVVEPGLEELVIPSREEQRTPSGDGPSVVILYNDDNHSMDEVVYQIQAATGYDIERCVGIMLEAHIQGRAIAYTGSSEDCERVAGILRKIRLQVETDRA